MLIKTVILGFLGLTVVGAAVGAIFVTPLAAIAIAALTGFIALARNIYTQRRSQQRAKQHTNNQTQPNVGHVVDIQSANPLVQQAHYVHFQYHATRTDSKGVTETVDMTIIDSPSPSTEPSPSPDPLQSLPEPLVRNMPRLSDTGPSSNHSSDSRHESRLQLS